MNTRILTSTEAARYLNVHATTLKRWIVQGEIDAYREPGGRWRISFEALRNFVHKRHVPDELLTSELTVAPERPFRALIACGTDQNRSRCRHTIENSFESVHIRETDNSIGTCIQIGLFQPDLVLLDSDIPDLNSINIARQIRSNPELNQALILLFADRLNSETIDRLGEYNVQVLPKMQSPFDSLAASIQQLKPEGTTPTSISPGPALVMTTQQGDSQQMAERTSQETKNESTI